MRQGFQPVLKPHHPQSETHRLQAFRLRDLREGLPEESGPPATQRNATLRDPPHTLNTLSPHSERERIFFMKWVWHGCMGNPIVEKASDWLVVLCLEFLIFGVNEA
ncbi:hypothetical protein CDAR_386451 [Caerostris darwini]|uniref:Uncharacterized protein n=1 Tax=Caerostris darwini TaxID=1538125 RepID=A0AAV4QGN9_9ARAC|nr:hypothetical protein CDAR_386451 [Caerostris darwini]